MIAFAAILALVLGICALAAFRPELAFLASVLLFGAEGSIKMLLTEDGTPLPFSDHAVGAALLDAALFFTVAVLLLWRRAEMTLLWRWLGRIGQAGVVLLGLWLALSVAQIWQGDDLAQAVDGFRLTQLYVVLAVAGAVACARFESITRYLLVGLALVAAYGALRAIVGPSEAERSYALARGGVTEFQQGEIFRAVGSFSGAVGMVSFLVPAAVFAFGVAFVGARSRILGLTLIVCAVAALVGTYVRAGVVALAVGVIAVLALTLRGRTFARSRKIAALTAAAGLLTGATVATAVAAQESPETRGRAGGLLRPASDESLALRREVWRDALSDIRAEPLGTGLGTVGHATSLRGGEPTTTDNSYLKIAREQGVLGVALFVLGLGALCLAVARRLLGLPAATRALGSAALGGFVAFLALAFVGEYIEQPGKVLAWTLLGLGAGLALRSTLPDEQPPSP